jgi:hypothetical protein
MFGLFCISQIEDYYDVDDLVAVSDDREKLEAYIQKRIEDFHFYKKLHEKYRAIKCSLPEFTEPRPEKKKLGFNPKTKEERAMVRANAEAFNSQQRAWDQRYHKFLSDQSNKAFDLLCEQEGLDKTAIEKDSIQGYHSYYSEPKYKIKEVEVW